MAEDRSKHLAWSDDDLEFHPRGNVNEAPEGSTPNQIQEHVKLLEDGFEFVERNNGSNVYRRNSQIVSVLSR